MYNTAMRNQVSTRQTATDAGDKASRTAQVDDERKPGTSGPASAPPPLNQSRANGPEDRGVPCRVFIEYPDGTSTTKTYVDFLKARHAYRQTKKPSAKRHKPTGTKIYLIVGEDVKEEFVWG